MTYKSYQGLNHLMMTCDPTVRDKLATPEEYNIFLFSVSVFPRCFFISHDLLDKVGNVDEEVIADIAKWVNSIC